MRYTKVVEGVNRENLQLLADYLLKKTITELNVEFNMEVYSEKHTAWRDHNCGSVGCAIGHWSWLCDKREDENFAQFSHRTLVNAKNTRKAFELWQFLFSGCWAGDNDAETQRQQAGLRINHFLNHGMPTKWDYSTKYE